MTNTNPLTDRLQKMAAAKFKEAIATFPIDELTRNSIEWIHQQSTLHTIKETLTAVEEEIKLLKYNNPLGERAINRDEALNDLLHNLTTLTSSNDSDV